MRVQITNSEDDTWYSNAINKSFDVTLSKHPTFGHLRYILENTERNQLFFKKSKDSELALLFLRDGYTGIKYEDAIVIYPNSKK